MGKLEIILFFFITTIIFLIQNACNTTACKNKIPTLSSNQGIEMNNIKVEKFRYFDVFSMQGIEPYDGDSAVIVMRTDDSISLKINFPERYNRTFRDMGSYWYSHSEFNMEKNRYFLTLSEAWPKRYDMFVFKDTILEYCQTYFGDEVIKDVYLKTRNTYYKLGWIEELSQDTLPEMIITKAKNLIKNRHNINARSYLELSVGRDESRVTFTDAENATSLYGYFPGPKVWGGEYELGMDEHIFL